MFRTVLRKLETEAVFGSVKFNLLGQQEIVRWRRKPRWLPTAKSKMFRVPPPRKQYPEEEAREFRQSFNYYRTQMKSIRRFFGERTKQSVTGPEVIAEQERLEHEDHLACIQINNEWNLNVAQIREQELLKDKEVTMEEMIKAIETNKLITEETKRKAEEIIRQEKERSKTYITEENIDEAIEHALANPVDYNFSIDVEENIYKGRYTRPEPPSQTPTDSSEQREKLAATG